MDIEDDDDFYAPEEPQVAPAEAKDKDKDKEKPTQTSDDLEEGEEEDEGAAMDEDDDSDSVGASCHPFYEVTRDSSANEAAAACRISTSSQSEKTAQQPLPLRTSRNALAQNPGFQTNAPADNQNTATSATSHSAQRPTTQ